MFNISSSSALYPCDTLYSHLLPWIALYSLYPIIMPAKKIKTDVSVEVNLPPEKLEALEATKAASKDALQSYMIFQSWTVDKSPGLKRVILPNVGNAKKRNVACPRGYRLASVVLCPRLDLLTFARPAEGAKSLIWWKSEWVTT